MIEDDTICKNYIPIDCPERCTFWDCNNFIPSGYFRVGIKEFKRNDFEEGD
jgi:hypothetical protein